MVNYSKIVLPIKSRYIHILLYWISDTSPRYMLQRRLINAQNTRLVRRTYLLYYIVILSVERFQTQFVLCYRVQRDGVILYYVTSYNVILGPGHQRL